MRGFFAGLFIGASLIMTSLYLAGDGFGCEFPQSVPECVGNILNHGDLHDQRHTRP